MNDFNKVIGEYNKETKEVERSYFRQGYIYKNYPVYYKGNPDEACYIPELSDEPYSANDFLYIADNNKELADYLFESVDWQSPETLMTELKENEEKFLFDKFKYICFDDWK